VNLFLLILYVPVGLAEVAAEVEVIFDGGFSTSKSKIQACYEIILYSQDRK
jgi:hypothetical protein